MRLLILSRYSRLGASSRLRTMQYGPCLHQAGFEVEYASLFDDDYLKRLYNNEANTGALLGYYLRRLAILMQKPRPDLIWIEKEALPWLPWFVERFILPKDVPIVSDYDDAVFHRYDKHRFSAIRWLLGKKIDRVMYRSALVTAGNRYLADHARHTGAAEVEIVPTVVDLAAYEPLEKSTTDADVVIGWIGSPSTWVEYMEPVLPFLTCVARDENARISAVGAGGVAEPHQLLDILPWSEDTEVASIQTMDIGIMPLTDTPWACGKCGYKLIQYMACGLPVIASPVGVNAEIVDHGVNGFLAATDAEWREALVKLLRDPDLRSRMGRAAREKVEKQYSLQVWGPRVVDILSQVAKARVA